MSLSVRRGRAVAGVLVPVLATALLAGCSLQSLGMSSDAHPSKSGSAHATHPSARQHPAEPAAAHAKVATVGGALAQGSRVHHLWVGNRQLELDYWTTQDPTTWTARSAVPVHLAAHLSGGQRTDAVLVSSFTATWSTDSAPAGQRIAGDSGRFVMTPPYSYTTALVIPPVGSSVRTAQLRVQLRLLVQIAPHEHQYARDTVLDQLNFTYPASTDTKAGTQS